MSEYISVFDETTTKTKFEQFLNHFRNLKKTDKIPILGEEWYNEMALFFLMYYEYVYNNGPSSEYEVIGLMKAIGENLVDYLQQHGNIKYVIYLGESPYKSVKYAEAICTRTDVKFIHCVFSVFSGRGSISEDEEKCLERINSFDLEENNFIVVDHMSSGNTFRTFANMITKENIKKKMLEEVDIMIQQIEVEGRRQKISQGNQIIFTTTDLAFMKKENRYHESIVDEKKIRKDCESMSKSTTIRCNPKSKAVQYYASYHDLFICNVIIGSIQFLGSITGHNTTIAFELRRTYHGFKSSMKQEVPPDNSSLLYYNISKNTFQDKPVIHVHPTIINSSERFVFNAFYQPVATGGDIKKRKHTKVKKIRHRRQSKSRKLYLTVN